VALDLPEQRLRPGEGDDRIELGRIDRFGLEQGEHPDGEPVVDPDGDPGRREEARGREEGEEEQSSTDSATWAGLDGGHGGGSFRVSVTARRDGTTSLASPE
jgi:hypothetical protein